MAKIRLTINVEDEASLCVAVSIYKDNKHQLPLERHKFIFGTRGTTKLVHDYSMYGTPERPKIYVGAGYVPPDWMVKEWQEI